MGIIRRDVLCENVLLFQHNCFWQRSVGNEKLYIKVRHHKFKIQILKIFLQIWWIFNGVKLLKITILGEQEHSVQRADRAKAVQVWRWGNMDLQKPRKWLSQHLYMLNKYLVPCWEKVQGIISESNHVMVSEVHSPKYALMFTTM